MLKHALVALTLALAVPAVGCGGTVQAEPPATADTATTRAPVATAAHGPVKFLGAALGQVPLTASQRQAVEQLATDAETRHAAGRAARADMMNTLAAQVEAGTLDRTALQPKLDAMAAAMAASQPADRAAFEQLHTLLTPDQRTAFVDALEGQVQSMHAGHKGPHGLAQWAADLQLTDDQKSQIKSAMMERFRNAKHDDKAEWKEHGHGGKDVMEAFKQDRFVFDEVAPAHDVGGMVNKMSEHVLGVAEVALPLLTPQQRTLAAQKLRAHAADADGDGHDLF